MSINDLRRKIAYTIFSLRTQDPNVRITKQDLANDVGVSVKYIYELENGKKMPSIEIIDKLARAFGMKLSDFCKIIEEQDI